MDFNQLQSSLNASLLTGTNPLLGNGGVSSLLDSMAIVRDLAGLVDIKEPVTSPEGLEKRLVILFSAAARAARLTGTTKDDELVAKLSKELLAPEVVQFLAYMARRLS
jgi:hypothetical protein